MTQRSVTQVAPRTSRRDDELREIVIDLAKRQRLDGWNEFVEELKVPSELAPALITNRPELVRLAQPRPLTADEAKALYTLVAALLETNMALREHASTLATMVHDWAAAFRGLHRVSGRIESFAQFRHNDAAAEGEDDD